MFSKMIKAVRSRREAAQKAKEIDAAVAMARREFARMDALRARRECHQPVGPLYFNRSDSEDEDDHLYEEALHEVNRIASPGCSDFSEDSSAFNMESRPIFYIGTPSTLSPDVTGLNLDVSKDEANILEGKSREEMDKMIAQILESSKGSMVSPSMACSLPKPSGEVFNEYVRTKHSICIIKRMCQNQSKPSSNAPIEQMKTYLNGLLESLEKNLIILKKKHPGLQILVEERGLDRFKFEKLDKIDEDVVEVLI